LVALQDQNQHASAIGKKMAAVPIFKIISNERRQSIIGRDALVF